MVAQRTSNKEKQNDNEKTCFLQHIGTGELARAGHNAISKSKLYGNNRKDSGDVVGTAAGIFDLARSTFFTEAGLVDGGVNPSFGVFATTGGLATLYSGVSGPTSFGMGGPFSKCTIVPAGAPSSSVGGAGQLALPMGYLTGNPLSGYFPFNNATFASLGITPGIYILDLGNRSARGQLHPLRRCSGADPDTGSSLSLLLMATGLVLSAARKRRAA